MNKMQKALAGIMAVVAVFFGFVVMRIGGAQTIDNVKVAKISTENNAQLGTEAYKDAYPLQYNSYMKNKMGGVTPTGYGGSDGGVSILSQEPEAVYLWKGYKFSIQYDVPRGHIYAGQDILNSKRIGGQKGSCVTCKTPYTMDVFYKEMGWGYATKTFAELAERVPADGWFGCVTCHDPETMRLRVYNPAFIEAMQRRGIDVNNASNNEMRAYVCGQCHVEYYFAKEDGRVTFPWDFGLDPESEYKYYQSEKAGGFKQDWVHPDSKTPMLKAQHPDFEAWSTSVHADAGVTCVDCHMPYMRENGQKYTSHWMTSPLKTVEESCLKCHDESKEVLIARVKTIHDNTFKLQRIAGQTCEQAHKAIAAAAAAGATDEQLNLPRTQLREAQFYWDLIEAENGVGFHNPDQCMRALGLSIDLAHKAIESAHGITAL